MPGGDSDLVVMAPCQPGAPSAILFILIKQIKWLKIIRWRVET